MSLPLSEIVQQKIHEEGPIRFRDFMEMALYYPELGYYTSSKEKFGEHGDYFTAPFFSNVYGRMIAKQLEEMWCLTGKKDFVIIEYGAGAGTLCSDILKNLKHNKSFYSKIKYCIVEKSKALQSKQQALFNASKDIAEKIRWIRDIKEISPFTGCVVANEVLDNFSVHKVIMKGKEFTFVKMISLILFVLVSIFLNSSSIKVLALNGDPVSTISYSYNNETINIGNNSMMLPGSNMTFVLSLDNAKVHLMEAIMDIKDNNIDGALMQLNLTSNYIKEHEHEMADMMSMIGKMKEK